MTQFEPRLALSRLVVMRNGHSVFDERFHRGVNIIRGENGGGKTTIADFIFFALGGEPSNWRTEALLCDFVLAEVEVNGSKATLRREVSKQPGRPMSIYWDEYDIARNSAEEGWMLYPYAHRGETQSFSQVIFKALEIPQVKGELASRITMHQLLRVMYVDQRSAFDDIFRTEQFDNKLTREAIGALICGVYDEVLYETEIKWRATSDEHDSVGAKLRQAYSILQGQTVSVPALREQAELRRRERKTLYAELLELQQKKAIGNTPENGSSTIVQALESQLRTLNAESVDLRDELETLNFEIADSDLFIRALEENLESLDESATVRTSLGGIRFEFCPACYAPIKYDGDADICPLCRSKHEGDAGGTQLLRLKQELSMQLDESRSLQRDRVKRKGELSEKLPILGSQRDAIRLRYRELATSTVPQIDASIGELHRKIGYIDRQIEDSEERIRFAATVEALSERKAELAAEMSRLKDEIQRRTDDQKNRSAEAYATISEITKNLLQQDLDREQTFRHVEKVTFDFGDGEIEVNERSNYAASSMVFLKNCFHLALLLASAQKPFFRYPRFVLFDNVEDKGMEPERSHNFQRLVVEASSGDQSEHQIIFTTSMIAPDLDTSNFTVGEYYTHAKKSLDILST